MASAERRSVIVAAVRTPVGRFGGALRDVPAVELGALSIREAVARVPEALADQIDYVLMGHVLQAGLGQNTARQASVAAGLPIHVPAMTVNKVCLASLSAVVLADQLIRAGDVEVVVAGGMESMSQAPHVLRDLRWGRRLGDARLVDVAVYDGLWSTFSDQHMGESSDEVNDEYGIDREDQDAWAARSHHRAVAAWDEGRYGDEIVDMSLSRDEGLRPSTSVEQLAQLRPAFRPEGTITAGNASQQSDGAACLLIMSADRADALGVAPLGEIVAHGMCAEQFAHLHTVPAIALQRALKKASLEVDALDLIEINEAFASVALHATRMLGADESRVNVNGGAIAIGHALGSTGARMTVTLIHELRRRGGGLGGVTLCGGGGQGEALVLRAV
jgi:acetyl-CoA C-acetyltransferase